MQDNPKGFTLIELLVVIAIIGILATVVLASLGAARNKGADASVKEALISIRNQAELYYLNQTPNSYGDAISDCTSGVFTDPIIASARAQILVQAVSGATMACATDIPGFKWAVSVSQLRSAGTSWCIDSTGFTGTKTAQTSGANQGTCQ